MELTVWAAKLTRELTEEEEANLMALLPPQRRERLERMSDREKRREPLCAYGLLLAILREQQGWQNLPVMEWSELGKPFFPDHPDVHFNLSHTKGAVLVGIHDHPLGVDIERIRPVSDRIKGYVGGASTPQEFFQKWVEREARVKYFGTTILSGRGVQAHLPDGCFQMLDTWHGYIAGLCAKTQPEEKQQVRLLTIEDLIG